MHSSLNHRDLPYWLVGLGVTLLLIGFREAIRPEVQFDTTSSYVKVTVPEEETELLFLKEASVPIDFRYYSSPSTYLHGYSPLFFKRHGFIARWSVLSEDSYQEFQRTILGKTCSGGFISSNLRVVYLMAGNDKVQSFLINKRLKMFARLRGTGIKLRKEKSVVKGELVTGPFDSVELFLINSIEVDG